LLFSSPISARYIAFFVDGPYLVFALLFKARVFGVLDLDSSRSITGQPVGSWRGGFKAAAKILLDGVFDGFNRG
jgi:hypothetical protein